MGGIFVDQLFVVRTISLLLPSGVKLYVREHHSTWNNVAYEHSYNRSIDFYREILSYKIVKLINYKNHPYELIRNFYCCCYNYRYCGI